MHQSMVQISKSMNSGHSNLNSSVTNLKALDLGMKPQSAILEVGLFGLIAHFPADRIRTYGYSDIL